MDKISNDEPANIANEDFRLQAITTIAEDFSLPGGPVHKTGASVMLIANTKFNGKTLSFGLPNISAMFLNFSNKLWKESNDYLTESSNFVGPISKYIDKNNLTPVKKELLFDALEKRMGAVVFAYSAIESFANQSIPAGYIYKQERSDKKFLEEYNREQIELFLSLDVKLDKILPNIFGSKSPKAKYGTQYSELKKLRDRIIHPKNDDTKSTGPEVATLWTSLLNTKKQNYAVDAKNIISHYYRDGAAMPRWLKKMPF